MPAEALSCERVAELLPGLLGGPAVADLAVQRHVDGCLRCQAEAVQYRKLLRALRQLRSDVLEPAPGHLARVLAGLEAAGERRAVRSLLSGRRGAYLGAAATAAAAGAAGALVLAARARSRRVPLAG